MIRAGQIIIAGKSKQPIIVNRLGYGTMRLTGEGIWGEPSNRPEAIQILKKAVASGVNFLDTADYYGEDVTNRLISEALYPYPGDLVICTKVGGARRPDKSWYAFNKPENIRTSIDNNLKTLRLEQIKLVHFRTIGSNEVPFEESMDAMFELQREGKILHIGVSNVNNTELAQAMAMGPIATIENMYGHGQRTTIKAPYGETRGAAELLPICEANQIPLIPFFSLLNSLGKKDDRIAETARKYGATEAQVHIAWLLHRSPWILPIPGTSSLAHFEENMGSAHLQLTAEDMAYLE